jgi:hypothetical protein
MPAQILALICGIAGTIGLAAGAGLLIADERMLRERSALRRWLLEIDLIALFDRRRSIERVLYRHHRAFGAAVIVAAIAWLVTLWALNDHPLAMTVLAKILRPLDVEAVILTSWVLAVFALGIGLILLIRPSALKKLEAAANRWVEPFPPSNNGTVPAETGVNWVILRAPHFVGVFLFAAGLVCLLACAYAD